MNKVLVTGGAGFIGHHLVEYLLEKGDDIIVLDNLSQGNKLSEDTIKNIQLIVGDIRDYDLLKKISVGCVHIYHFAATLGVEIVSKDHKETMEIESIGMQNIARVAIQNNIHKILYASTSGVYGKGAFEISVEEDFVVDPRTSYAIAKRFNEIYLKSIWDQNNISTISIRYFNVYGPKQDTRMVIPRFITQAKENRPISVFGDGKQTRDFTYVTDAIRTSYNIAQKISSGSEIFNICGNNEASIYDLATKIKALTHSKSEIKILSTPTDRIEFEVQRRSGSTSKIEKILGKQDYVSLDDGLEKLIGNNNYAVD